MIPASVQDHCDSLIYYVGGKTWNNMDESKYLLLIVRTHRRRNRGTLITYDLFSSEPRLYISITI